MNKLTTAQRGCGDRNRNQRRHTPGSNAPQRGATGTQRARGGVARRWVTRLGKLAAGVTALLGLAGCAGNDEPVVDCTLIGQNEFVAGLMSDLYLWYDRTPDVNPAQFDSPRAVLNAMAFREKDRWSSLQEAASRQRFFEEGEFVGLGVQFVTDSNDDVRVALVHVGSPADEAGMRRGMKILAVNGTSIEDIREQNQFGSIDGPNEAGVEVDYRMEDRDGSIVELTAVKGDVELQTARSSVIELDERQVGYVLFTSFLLPSIGQLRAVFGDLKDQGVEELVIDLRYNGGGLLRTAAALSGLVAGGEEQGKPLALLRYNDLHPEFNGRINVPEENAALGMDRLFVLTGPGTASASELLINGLRPFMPVRQIGTVTVGKPVGSNSWAHCGNAVSPITFRVLNADGEGNYFDGLAPDCSAPDDVLRDLGDPEEARLQAALQLMQGRECPMVAEDGIEQRSRLLRPGDLGGDVFGQDLIHQRPLDEHALF